MHYDSTILFLTAACFFAVAAAGFDVRSRRIPNAITGPAFLAGLLLHGIFSGYRGVLTSLAGALVCGVIFLVFYVAGGMGAGDVKLVAALGSLVGLSLSGQLLVFTTLSGGVMALVLALSTGRLKQTLRNIVTLVSHHARHGVSSHDELNVTNEAMLRLPYGVAIAFGSLAVFCVQEIKR